MIHSPVDHQDSQNLQAEYLWLLGDSRNYLQS